jgi:cytochrome c-type biogenesis protein CcmH
VLLAALPAAAGALTVNEVAREVRCPTCNTPLDVSNSPAASDMKAFIAERIDRGWDKARIIDALRVEFGDGVLATPPKSGFDLIAWVVPGLAVLAGIAVIGLLAWSWSRRRPAAAAEAPPPTPEEARRLEDELRRMR